MKRFKLSKDERAAYQLHADASYVLFTVWRAVRNELRSFLPKTMGSA